MKTLFSILFTITALSLHGDTHPQLQIGVVDQTSLLRTSLATGVNRQLSKELQTQQTILRNKRMQVQAFEERLATEFLSLSQEERDARNAKLEKLQSEVENAARAYQKELQAFTEEIHAKQMPKLKKVIKRIAKEKGLLLVVRSEDLLYFDPSRGIEKVDITEPVIRTFYREGES